MNHTWTKCFVKSLWKGQDLKIKQIKLETILTLEITKSNETSKQILIKKQNCNISTTKIQPTQNLSGKIVNHIFLTNIVRSILILYQARMVI